jgi:hypothetical protein
MSDLDAGTPVVSLLFPGSPVTVRFRVTLIVLDPLKSHAFRLIAHVGMKINELVPP